MFSSQAGIFFGTPRALATLALILGAVNALSHCINLPVWVIPNRDRISSDVLPAYWTFTILDQLVFWFLASPFFMWAWRYPVPIPVAYRRLATGMILHFFVCTLPIALCDISIVWDVKLDAFIQVWTFFVAIFTVIEEGLQVWFFLMMWVPKLFGCGQSPGGYGNTLYEPLTPYSGNVGYRPQYAYGPSANPMTYSPPPGLWSPQPLLKVGRGAVNSRPWEMNASHPSAAYFMPSPGVVYGNYVSSPPAIVSGPMRAA